MKDFIIEKSKDNYNILKIIDGEKGKYIGSKYNQKREIDKCISELRPFTEKDIYVIWGLSFGEQIKKLLEENKFNNKILIIDVFEKWVEYFKNKEDLERIIKNKNVKIASNLEEVKVFFRECVNDFNIDWVKISYYGKYDSIFKEETKEIFEFIRDEFYLRISNKNTNIHFGEKWFETLLKNLKFMINGTSVNKLEKKYKNKPAVIVSAGPSLDKNIRELKGKENILILSGGRTIKPLVENNIEPTLLGVVDPGEISFNLISQYIDSLKCPLLFYEGTNEKVVEKHKGEKIFYTNSDFIRGLLKENIVDFALGGSIAHALTAFAGYMGCSPIIFIGQDLAYTDEKYHSDSSNKQINNKIANWEHFFYVNDIYGEKVKTSPVLNDFRIVLEELIKLFPESSFINATEGGANIKGTKIMKLSEVLENLVEEKLVFKIEDKKKLDLNEKAIDSLEEHRIIFKELKESSKKGLNLLNQLVKYHKLKSNKINYVLKELDTIDERIKNNLSKLHLVKNLIFTKMNLIENNLEYVITELDSKEIIFDKNINKNKEIYKLLFEILDSSEILIIETIKNLQN